MALNFNSTYMPTVGIATVNINTTVINHIFSMLGSTMEYNPGQSINADVAINGIKSGWNM
jgi:hypothetical protein